MRDIGFYLFVSGFLLSVALVSFVKIPRALFLFLLALGLAFFVASNVRRAYVLPGILFIALVAGGVRTSLVAREIPDQFSELLGTEAVLTGTLVRPPDLRESSIRLTIETERDGVRTRLIAVVPPYGRYRVGDRVTVSGLLKEPEPFATDGGRSFAYDRFLAKDGIFAITSPARAKVIGREGGVAYALLGVLQDARDSFIRALNRALPEPESALAAGLIAGGKQGLGKELLQDFTVSGLLPIVVLSGYNVMIVAEGVLRTLGFLPRRLALFIGGLCIVLFVLAAGAGAASFRAGLMAVFALVARATGKTYAVLLALFLSLILMLLENPLLLVFDPGLQFSFVATLGLIVGAPLIVRWVRTRSAFLRDIVASTVAAQLAVLPLLLYQTGNLSLVSVGANILVLPAVPLAMATGTLAAGAALLPLPEVLLLLLGLPAHALLSYIVAVAEWSASLPLARLIVPMFPFWVVVVSYAMLLFAVWIAKARPA